MQRGTDRNGRAIGFYVYAEVIPDPKTYNENWNSNCIDEFLEKLDEKIKEAKENGFTNIEIEYYMDLDESNEEISETEKELEKQIREKYKDEKIKITAHNETRMAGGSGAYGIVSGENPSATGGMREMTIKQQEIRKSKQNKKSVPRVGC